MPWLYHTWCDCKSYATGLILLVYFAVLVYYLSDQWSHGFCDCFLRPIIDCTNGLVAAWSHKISLFSRMRLYGGLSNKTSADHSWETVHLTPDFHRQTCRQTFFVFVFRFGGLVMKRGYPKTDVENFHKTNNFYSER